MMKDYKTLFDLFTESVVNEAIGLVRAAQANWLARGSDQTGTSAAAHDSRASAGALVASIIE